MADAALSSLEKASSIPEDAPIAIPFTTKSPAESPTANPATAPLPGTDEIPSVADEPSLSMVVPEIPKVTFSPSFAPI